MDPNEAMAVANDETGCVYCVARQVVSKVAKTVVEFVEMVVFDACDGSHMHCWYDDLMVRYVFPTLNVVFVDN